MVVSAPCANNDSITFFLARMRKHDVGFFCWRLASRQLQKPASRRFFFAHSLETSPDLPQPASYSARMDDDHDAYKFGYARYLARQVDREAAQMIVEAAEAGLIGIEQATEALTRMSRQAGGPSALQSALNSDVRLLN